MSQTKRAGQSDQVMRELQLYLQNLAEADPQVKTQELVTIIGTRIDKVRVFERTPQGVVKLSETPIDYVPVGFGKSQSPKRRLLAKLKASRERLVISDSELSIDFTVDEDGTVELGVQTDPALEGQDLSALLETEAPAVDTEFDVSMDDQFLSTKTVAQMTEAAVSTVTRRIAKNEILGFRVFKKKWRIPKDQFHNGDVIKGVTEIIRLFDGDHKEAWYFLSAPLFYGDSDPRPIDRLRAVKGQKEFDDCLRSLTAVQDSYERGDHF